MARTSFASLHGGLLNRRAGGVTFVPAPAPAPEPAPEPEIASEPEPPRPRLIDSETERQLRALPTVRGVQRPAPPAEPPAAGGARAPASLISIVTGPGVPAAKPKAPRRRRVSLRLDASRHLRLQLAKIHLGRSGQDILTAALDRYLASLGSLAAPELATVKHGQV